MNLPIINYLENIFDDWYDKGYLFYSVLALTVFIIYLFFRWILKL